MKSSRIKTESLTATGARKKRKPPRSLAKRSIFDSETAVEAGRKGGMMRGPVRALANLDWGDDKDVTPEKMLARLKEARGGMFKTADLLAVAHVDRAAKNGAEYQAMCDSVDGKLIEKHATVEVKGLAELLAADDIDDDDDDDGE